MLSKEELQEMIVVYGNNHNACRAARELLSLREQLAALKALEPFCHVFLHPDGPLFNGIVSDSCAGHAGVIPLFTAAKQADSVTLPAPANYEDYGPMVSLEKTMAALALCGIEYTVKK